MNQGNTRYVLYDPVLYMISQPYFGIGGSSIENLRIEKSFKGQVKACNSKNVGYFILKQYERPDYLQNGENS